MKKLLMIWMLGVAMCAACSDDGETSDSSPVAAEIALSESAPAEVPLGGGPVEVTVTSNGTWRLSGKKIWCHPSAVSGKSGEKVVFTVDANDTGESRTTVYKFFCGDKTVPFTVTQQPANVFHITSDTEFDVMSAGGDVLVKVEGNVEFSYVVEEAAKGWIIAPGTRAVEKQNIAFLVKENDSFGERSGKILFTADGKEYPVVVKQRMNSAIIVDRNVVNLEPAGGDFTLNVQSNIAYTVEVEKGVAWLTHKNAIGPLSLDKHTETFTATAAVAARSAKITFRATDGSVLPVVVTVSQTAPEKVLVDVPDMNFRNYLGAGSNQYVIKLTGISCEVTEKGLSTKVINLGSSQRQIKSLEGISAFVSVTEITCTNNPLETIPLGDLNVTSLSIDNQWSKDKCGVNVKISGTKINSINLSNNTKTVTIDVSGCPALGSLSVGGCSALTTVYLKTGQTVNISGGSPAIEYR